MQNLNERPEWAEHTVFQQPVHDKKDKFRATDSQQGAGKHPFELIEVNQGVKPASYRWTISV
jgi:hypothetical protein